MHNDTAKDQLHTDTKHAKRLANTKDTVCFFFFATISERAHRGHLAPSLYIMDTVREVDITCPVSHVSVGALKGLVVILALATVLKPIDSETQYFANQNLRSVPHQNISSTVKFINLNHNQISEIESFPSYTFLRRIDLFNNSLSEFPDFYNISATIQVLTLSHNYITYIKKDRLVILDLEKLYLANNRIKIFPDMPPDWGGNLMELDLSVNQLNTLPTLPGLNSEARVIILQNDGIICNCKLKRSIWKQTRDGKCDKPPDLTRKAGRYINHISQPVWEMHGKMTGIDSIHEHITYEYSFQHFTKT